MGYKKQFNIDEVANAFEGRYHFGHQTSDANTFLFMIPTSEDIYDQIYYVVSSCLVDLNG